MSTVNQATNDDDFPIEQFLTDLYTVKSFDFENLTFVQLPERVQGFLLESGLGDPATQQSLGLDIPEAYHPLMLKVREDEQSAMDRDTYELNWDIVSCMLALTPPPPGQLPTPRDQLLLHTLTNELIPDWKSYLDRGLERIDALIWFEIVLTQGTDCEQPLQIHLALRKDDANRMLETSIRSLQRIYEYATGRRSEIADAQPVEGIEAEDAQTPEDSNSDNDDATSDISTSDSDASVGTPGYEEHLFSDGEPEPQTEGSSRRYVHENIKYYDGHHEYTYWSGCDFFTDRGRNFVPRSSSSF